jgi:hypothetical protein
MEWSLIFAFAVVGAFFIVISSLALGEGVGEGLGLLGYMGGGMVVLSTILIMYKQLFR